MASQLHRCTCTASCSRTFTPLSRQAAPVSPSAVKLRSTNSISATYQLHRQRQAVSRARTAQCTASDSQSVREQATGVEFPLTASLWEGEKFRCLGAGARTKKVAFVGVKVYAVALYVEAEKAAHELGIRSRGGFFETDDDYTQAIADGAFTKMLQVQLVRKVDGEAFFGAIEEALTPRLSVTGEMATLGKFKKFFEGKSLEKGTNILLLWRTQGVLDVLSKPAGHDDFSTAQPDLQIDSPGLCRALFEVYLGQNTVVPDAKASWVSGAKALLETEEVVETLEEQALDSRAGQNGVQSVRGIVDV